MGALDFAYEVGARVVNLSLGGTFPGLEAQLDAAFSLANQRNIMVAIAAGNSGYNMDTPDQFNFPREWPCAFPYPNIICVANMSNSGVMNAGSTHGPISVDLGAPGTSTYGAYKDTPLTNAYWAQFGLPPCHDFTINGFDPGPGCYQFLNGTSMATPHVAGCLGLMLQKNPGATVSQLRQAMLSTVQLNASLIGKVATEGQLDCAAAIAATPPPQGGGPPDPPMRREQ
jgi:subtilisin family serine protease